MQVQAEIKKWGNSLGLRVTGPMRDVPAFTKGTKVDIEVTEEGLMIRKAKKINKPSFLFSEAELLEGMTPAKAHAELVTKVLDTEW